MSDPLLKSEIHAERNTGILATGYDSRIQAYITGQGTPFASGYAKNHILRDLNRKLFNHGLSSYITDSYDAGFRPTTLTGILAAGGGGGGTTIVSNESLVSFWKLDEASGTRSDAFGSNHLTDNNTVGQSSVSGAPYSDQTDFEKDNSEYLSIADNASLSFGNESMTICCWVNMESVIQACFAGKWNSSIDREYLLYYSLYNNRFQFGIYNGTSQIFANSTAGAASANTWYFVAAQYDADADLAKISVNGGAWDTTANSGGIFDGASDFRVGNYFDGANAWMDGEISSMGLWRRALSDAEITALANKDDPFYNQF